MDWRHKAFSATFEAMALMRADRWGKAIGQGRGAILTLHHVRPAPATGFRPNALLEIEPDFLERVVKLVRAEGYEIVSLDEAVERLASHRPSPFFVVLTFDDGYRDNLDHAWPVLGRHQVPWTMFVTPGFADRTARLWWLELEEAIRVLPRFSLDWPGGVFSARTGTDTEKQLAFARLYWRLRKGRKRFCSLRFPISAGRPASIRSHSWSGNACPGRCCARSRARPASPSAPTR